MRDAIIKTLYETLSKELRELEKNFIAFVIGVLSALAVYGKGVKIFLDNAHNKNEDLYLCVLIFATFISVFICIIICISANIFGYTYRVNQTILSRIEWELCLYKHPVLNENGSNRKCEVIDDSVLPKSFNLYKKLKECDSTDLPEVYKFIKICASILAAIFIIFTIIIVLEVKQLNINCLVLFISGFIIIGLCLWKFRWDDYHQKLKKLSKKSE